MTNGKFSSFSTLLTTQRKGHLLFDPFAATIALTYEHRNH
jgi:hypothetical protein